MSSTSRSRRRARQQRRMHSNDDLIRIAEQASKKSGLKFTKIRRHIYEVLLNADRPVGAYDLLKTLEGIGAVQPPTAYRALNWLLELGLIRKIASTSKFVALMSGPTTEPVAFVVCRDCGRAEQMEIDEHARAILAAAELQGYGELGSTIELTGRCSPESDDCEPQIEGESQEP